MKVELDRSYNPSQNILRPTPNGLIFCSFLWKHICSLRKGNNIYAPLPTKQCCFQMIIFTPKSPPITPTTLLCQGKGQKIDAVSEFLWRIVGYIWAGWWLTKILLLAPISLNSITCNWLYEKMRGWNFTPAFDYIATEPYTNLMIINSTFSLLNMQLDGIRWSCESTFHVDIWRKIQIANSQRFKGMSYFITKMTK